MSWPSKNRGFSLVELLITVVVMITITTVLVFKQKSYNNTAILNNTIQNLALDIRQMQVYGTSVRQASTDTDFSNAYGFEMRPTDTVSTGRPAVSRLTTASYVIFVDRNKDLVYSGTPSCLDPECVSKIALPTGYLASFCRQFASGSDDCSMGLTGLDVSFLRPSLTPTIVVRNPSGNIVPSPGLKSVKINVYAPSGDSRSVIINTAGQISVQ